MVLRVCQVRRRWWKNGNLVDRAAPATLDRLFRRFAMSPGPSITPQTKGRYWASRRDVLVVIPTRLVFWRALL